MADAVDPQAVAEVGHAVWDEFGPAAEQNWKLRWPQSIRTYARMAREDSQVKSVLKAVSLPVRRTTWRIDPNGADPEVVRLVAEDLRLPVLGDDGGSPTAQTGGHASFAGHLKWVLKMLVFGHAYFEVVFREQDGQDRLWKLAYRPPESIAEIRVERDGGLAGIRQHPAPGDKVREINIPVQHLLAYVNDPMDFSWRGESELRAAYKHWILRDQFMLLEENVLDRNGMGVPVYTGATNDQGEIAAGRKLATGLRAGKTSGAAVPYGAKLELKGVSGQLVNPREAISYHDSMIARSVLAHFLNLEGKGGSYSLAEIQAETFTQSLQTLAEDIAETVNQHLVERMVNLAFDREHGPYPRVTFDPIGSVKDLPMETLTLLVNAGVVLPDKDLEDEVRRRGGMPAKRPKSKAKAENPDLGKPSAEELEKVAKAIAALVGAGYSRDEAAQILGFEGLPEPGEPDPATTEDTVASDVEVVRALLKNGWGQDDAMAAVGMSLADFLGVPPVDPDVRERATAFLAARSNEMKGGGS